MEPVKIFITGGTGFIGKHFLEALKKWPGQAEIFVLVRKNMVFDDPRVVKVKGDLRNIEENKELIKNCDYIFHLGANVNFFKAKSEDDKVNYDSTKKIIDLLKAGQNNLKNFIFISTIGAVDRHPKDDCSAPLNINSTPYPTTFYGKSKLNSEDYIRQSGLPATIIRPTWVYGKGMREISHINSFVSLVYNQVPIYRINFYGKVSLIHVEDLVSSLVSCLGNLTIIGKTYFATTEAQTIGDMFKVIYKKINGKETWQLPVPHFFRKVVSKVHSKISLTVANLFVDYLYADGQDFLKDFNVVQSKSLADGVDDVLSTNTSLLKRVKIYVQKNKLGFLGVLLKQSLYPLNFFKQVLPDSGTVLDFGCGEGMLTNSIALMLNNIKIIGYDKDASKIEQAKNASAPNAEFVNLPIETVEFSDARAVIMNDMLHHHEKTKQIELIEKAVKCLAPDGVIILKEVDAKDTVDRIWTKFLDSKLYPKDNFNFRSAEEWDKLLSNFGFVRIKHHCVKHFWPASRNIYVYSRSPERMS